MTICLETSAVIILRCYCTHANPGPVAGLDERFSLIALSSDLTWPEDVDLWSDWTTWQSTI